MTIAFDVPEIPSEIRETWESVLPKIAAAWSVGRTGNVMLGAATYYLQRTGADSLRLTANKESLTVAPAKEETLAALYAELWGALFGARDASPWEQARILAHVERDLPQQCGCSWSWNEWKRQHHPKFGVDFFQWLVDAKNDVRRRQRKSTMTLEEVRALYA